MLLTNSVFELSDDRPPFLAIDISPIPDSCKILDI